MVDSPASLPDRSIFTGLDPRYLAMLERGVPTMVASCDARFRPSVALAAGCALDVARGELTVFVARKSAGRLLDDIASGGRVAVMCVEPISHRAVQFKSGAVRSRRAEASDGALLARYLASVEDELLQVGHSRDYARCITSRPLRDLVALTFAPDEAFNQAPGPHAGVALSP